MRLFISLIFCSLIYSASCQLSNSGLEIFFPFSGNALDNSGFNNHGTVNGAELTTDRFGNANSAYLFDGKDDYIEINTVSNLHSIQDYTLSLWYNCYNLEFQTSNKPNYDQQYIFDAHSYSNQVTSNFYAEGPYFSIHNPKVGVPFIRSALFLIPIVSYHDDIIPNNSPFLNNWYHVASVRQGNLLKHYLNGSLVNTTTAVSRSFNMAHNMFIGTFAGNNPYYNGINYNFDGKIDDILIFSRALDENEIANIFKLPTNKLFNIDQPENPIPDPLPNPDTLVESKTYLSILYPNPAAEVVYLKINNFEGPLSITIHDDKSSLVKILNTQVKKNTPIPIQVGYLAAGVYMIKLNADGFTETHRLVTY